jgi:hypothetical protein
MDEYDNGVTNTQVSFDFPLAQSHRPRDIRSRVKHVCSCLTKFKQQPFPDKYGSRTHLHSFNQSCCATPFRRDCPFL